MAIQKLTEADFFPLNLLEGTYPVRVDLVYAKKDHPDNHFLGLYHPDARLLWVEKNMLRVLLLASLLCKHRHGWTLKVNDVLRPVEAQIKMAEFGYSENVISRPGKGPHPRGMAIDIEPLDEKGQPIDMGTPYDYFTDDVKKDPAARNATAFEGRTADESKAILERRKKLDKAVDDAAKAFGEHIIGLDSEWWDCRFPDGKDTRQTNGTYWGDFAPLSEDDLPSYMWLVRKPEPVPAHVQTDFKEFADLIDRDVREQASKIGIGKN